MNQRRGRDGTDGSADADQAPELGADFAEEHTSPTYADQQRGGLEGSAETESPEGYAGMDRGRRLLRRLFRRR